MKNLVMVLAATMFLGACGTTHDAMSYLQSDTTFCPDGTQWKHNADGTATKLYGAGGVALPCSR